MARRAVPRGWRVIFSAVTAVAFATLSCSADDPASTSTDGTDGTAGDSAALDGPALPPNPHLGPAGTATSHGDSGSSDTTPFAGPGSDEVDVRSVDLGAVCPSILIGSDDVPVALCTRVADVRPVVLLLDPATSAPLASMELTAGSLFGGVYGYLDDADRMVLVDGANELLRIGHRRSDGQWALEVVERRPLGDAVEPGDAVTSVTPGYDGAVWFATAEGTVGAVDPDDPTVRTVALPEGERIANSISSAPVGTAVASDHALYLFDRDDGGRIEQRWRQAYDRGPARKPGQLSWGTGSTPTFFGPDDGADYVAVVDNADPVVHLVVVAAGGDRAGERICRQPVLERGGPGSENSPIGVGRTVVVAGTYGYPYPRLPEGAGPSEPESAPFAGGMTRVDVREDATGCEVVWDSDVASVAVPKLSTADGTITTVTRLPATAATDVADDGPAANAYTVIDADSGELLAQQQLGTEVPDPLQLAGTIGPDRVLHQGTLGSVLRITPRDGGD